jgi:hypothetical protein
VGDSHNDHVTGFFQIAVGDLTAALKPIINREKVDLFEYANLKEIILRQQNDKNTQTESDADAGKDRQIPFLEFKECHGRWVDEVRKHERGTSP